MSDALNGVSPAFARAFETVVQERDEAIRKMEMYRKDYFDTKWKLDKVYLAETQLKSWSSENLAKELVRREKELKSKIESLEERLRDREYEE